MEEKIPSPLTSSLNYGLYLGIALIVISLIYYLTGNFFVGSSQWVNYLVMTTGIVSAQLNYRKNTGDIMTYGQALSVGVLTMLFASIVLSVFTLLLYEFIDPGLKEQMQLSLEEQLVNKGNMTEEQISVAMQLISTFQKPLVMAVMGIFSGTFTGLIISLITSIFTKKKQPE